MAPEVKIPATNDKESAMETWISKTRSRMSLMAMKNSTRPMALFMYSRSATNCTMRV